MGDLAGIPFSERALQELLILQSAHEFGVLQFVSIDVKMRCLLCDMCAEGAESVLNHVQNQHAVVPPVPLPNGVFDNKTGCHTELERLTDIQKQSEPSIYEEEQDTLFDFDFKPPMLDLQSEFDFQNDGALHVMYTQDIISTGANVKEVSLGPSGSCVKQNLCGLSDQSLCNPSEPIPPNVGNSSCQAAIIREIAIQSCDQMSTNQISPQEAKCDLPPLVASQECEQPFQLDSDSSAIVSYVAILGESAQAADSGSSVNTVSSDGVSTENTPYFDLDSTVEGMPDEVAQQGSYSEFSVLPVVADNNIANIASHKPCPEEIDPTSFDVSNMATVGNGRDSCFRENHKIDTSCITTINEKDFMDDFSCKDDPGRNAGLGADEEVVDKLSTAEHSYSKMKTIKTEEAYQSMESDKIVGGNKNYNKCCEDIPASTMCIVEDQEKIRQNLSCHKDDEAASKKSSKMKEIQNGALMKDVGYSFIIKEKPSYCDIEDDVAGTNNGTASRSNLPVTGDKPDQNRSSKDELCEAVERRLRDSTDTKKNMRIVRKKNRAPEKKMDYKWKTSVVLATCAGSILKENDLKGDSQMSVKKRNLKQEESTVESTSTKSNLTNLVTAKSTGKRRRKNNPEKDIAGPCIKKSNSNKGELTVVNLTEAHIITPDEKSGVHSVASKSRPVNNSIYKDVLEGNDNRKSTEKKQTKQKGENKNHNKNRATIYKWKEASKSTSDIEKEKRPLTCVYCAEQFPSIAECFQHYEEVHNDGLQSRVEKTNQTLMSENVKKLRNVYITSRTGKDYVDDFGIGIRVDIRMLKMLAKGDKGAVRKLQGSDDVDFEDVGHCLTSDDSETTENADDNSSTDAADLLKSKRKATNSDRYRTCPLCYQKLKKDALESHVAVVHYWNRVSRNNHSSGEFVCELCSKVFKYKKNLDSHRKGVHEGQRRYNSYSSRPELKCESCDYVSKERRRLEVHVQSKHMGLMPYKCQYCEFTSRERTAMKDHTYRHFKQKPVSCAYCDFACIQKSSMKTHLAKKHNVVLPTLSSCKQLSSTSEGRLKRLSILKEHKKHMTINSISDIDVKKIDIHALLGPTYSEKELKDQKAEKTLIENENDKSAGVISSESQTEDGLSETSEKDSLLCKLTQQNRGTSSSCSPNIKEVSNNSQSQNVNNLGNAKPPELQASVSNTSFTLMPANRSHQTPLVLPVVSGVQTNMVSNTLPIGQAFNGSSTQPSVLYRLTPSVTIVSSTKASTIQYKPVTSALPVLIGPAGVMSPLPNQNYRYMTTARQMPGGYGNNVKVLAASGLDQSTHKVVKINADDAADQRSNAISVQEILLSDNNHYI